MLKQLMVNKTQTMHPLKRSIQQQIFQLTMNQLFVMLLFEMRKKVIGLIVSLREIFQPQEDLALTLYILLEVKLIQKEQHKMLMEHLPLLVMEARQVVRMFLQLNLKFVMNLMISIVRILPMKQLMIRVMLLQLPTIRLLVQRLTFSQFLDFLVMNKGLTQMILT